MLCNDIAQSVVVCVSTYLVRAFLSTLQKKETEGLYQTIASNCMVYVPFCGLR